MNQIGISLHARRQASVVIFLVNTYLSLKASFFFCNIFSPILLLSHHQAMFIFYVFIEYQPHQTGCPPHNITRNQTLEVKLRDSSLLEHVVITSYVNEIRQQYPEETDRTKYHVQLYTKTGTPLFGRRPLITYLEEMGIEPVLDQSQDNVDSSIFIAHITNRFHPHMENPPDNPYPAPHLVNPYPTPGRNKRRRLIKTCISSDEEDANDIDFLEDDAITLGEYLPENVSRTDDEKVILTLRQHHVELRTRRNMQIAAWVYAQISQCNTCFKGIGDLRLLKKSHPTKTYLNVVHCMPQVGKTLFQCLAAISLALQGLYPIIFVMNSNGSSFLGSFGKKLIEIKDIIFNLIENECPFRCDTDPSWKEVFNIQLLDTIKLRKTEENIHPGKERSICILIGNVNQTRCDRLFKKADGTNKFSIGPLQETLQYVNGRLPIGLIFDEDDLNAKTSSRNKKEEKLLHSAHYKDVQYTENNTTLPCSIRQAATCCIATTATFLAILMDRHTKSAINMIELQPPANYIRLYSPNELSCMDTPPLRQIKLEVLPARLHATSAIVSDGPGVMCTIRNSIPEYRNVNYKNLIITGVRFKSNQSHHHMAQHIFQQLTEEEYQSLPINIFYFNQQSKTRNPMVANLYLSRLAIDRFRNDTEADYDDLSDRIQEKMQERRPDRHYKLMIKPALNNIDRWLSAKLTVFDTSQTQEHKIEKNVPDYIDIIIVLCQILEISPFIIGLTGAMGGRGIGFKSSEYTHPLTDGYFSNILNNEKKVHFEALIQQIGRLFGCDDSADTERTMHVSYEDSLHIYDALDYYNELRMILKDNMDDIDFLETFRKMFDNNGVESIAHKVIADQLSLTRPAVQKHYDPLLKQLYETHPTGLSQTQDGCTRRNILQIIAAMKDMIPSGMINIGHNYTCLNVCIGSQTTGPITAIDIFRHMYRYSLLQNCESPEGLKGCHSLVFVGFYKPVDDQPYNQEDEKIYFREKIEEYLSLLARKQISAGSWIGGKLTLLENGIMNKYQYSSSCNVSQRNAVLDRTFVLKRLILQGHAGAYLTTTEILNILRNRDRIHVLAPGGFVLYGQRQYWISKDTDVKQQLEDDLLNIETEQNMDNGIISSQDIQGEKAWIYTPDVELVNMQVHFLMLHLLISN